MQYPVLLISKLTDVMQVLLSKFQDLQLDIVLAPVQRWVQMRGKVNYARLPWQGGNVLGTLHAQMGEANYPGLL